VAGASGWTQLILLSQTVTKNKEDCRALVERAATITCAIIKTAAAVAVSHSEKSAATRALLENIDTFTQYALLVLYSSSHSLPVLIVKDTCQDSRWHPRAAKIWALPESSTG
jgi:hypothetical protein